MGDDRYDRPFQVHETDDPRVFEVGNYLDWCRLSLSYVVLALLLDAKQWREPSNSLSTSKAKRMSIEPRHPLGHNGALPLG